EILHILTLGEAPYTDPGVSDRFRHNAFFIGANVREAVRRGAADFTPVFLSEIPGLLRGGRLQPDAALIQVSFPSLGGLPTLGVSVAAVRAAVDSARILLAEVNPRMPRTHGDTRIALRRCTFLVPVDRPIPERPPPAPDAISEAIGAHVAELVPDG